MRHCVDIIVSNVYDLKRLLEHKSVVDTSRNPFAMIGGESLRLTCLVWDEDQERVDVDRRRSYVKWNAPLYLAAVRIGGGVSKPNISNPDWHNDQFISNIYYNKKRCALGFEFDTMSGSVEIEIGEWDVSLRKWVDPVGLYWEEDRYVFCILELVERRIELNRNLLGLVEAE